MYSLFRLKFAVHIQARGIGIAIIRAHHVIPAIFLKLGRALHIRQALVPFTGERKGKLAVHVAEQPAAFVVAIVLDNPGNASPFH